MSMVEYELMFTMAFLPPEPPFADPGHAEKVETSGLAAGSGTPPVP